MAKGNRRLHRINREEVLRLQRLHGLSDEKLAEKAEMWPSTLRNWLNGKVEGAFLSKIRKLAAALGVTPDRIIDAPGKALKPTVEPAESYHFDMNIKFQGSFSDPTKLLALTHAVGGMMDNLAERGIDVSGHQAQVSLFTDRDGDLKRIIVLIYGMLENGNPFWLFAAVRPSRYQLFQITYKEGAIDLYHFETFGEIIVSGEGSRPPDEVTLKVAEMYQTPPHVLFSSIDQKGE